MDASYAVAPASVVFPAVARFVAALKAMTDLEAQWGKFACFSPKYDLATCPWREAFGVPIGEVALTGGGRARGVLVGGVPVGTAEYEVQVLRDAAAEMVSYIDKTVEQLQFQPQHLWPCIDLACQTKLDFQLRHVWPTRTTAAARRLDEALLTAADSIAGYPGALRDPLIRRRLALATRMRGGALRRREELAPIAFVSNFVETTPRFADRAGEPGFFPMLEDLFPSASFDAGGTRFAAAINADVDGHGATADTVAVFAWAWRRLETEVAGANVHGPLDEPAINAGRGRSELRGLQRAITTQVEQVRRDALHAEFAALPVDDPRREAWFAADKLSPQFLKALPAGRNVMSAEEFRECFTNYFGAHSKLIAPFAGRSIPCGGQGGSRVCDLWGRQLGLATLPGGGMTDCHDECGNALFELMLEAGYRFELEPRSVFTSLIPPATLLHARTPPRIVPDAMGAAAMPAAATARNARRGNALASRVLLWDVKTIHGGSTWYSCARARDDQSGAVAERAHAVNGGPRGGEYGRHARALDFQFSRHGTTPVADRLASFTQVRGLVFGQYAEASLDVHALIDLAAHALARKHWRSSGARNEAEARSWWVSICRRRIGVAVARAYARYRIRRMVFIGVPRAVLDDRARRGVAGVAGGADGGHRADVDLRDFYRYQVHVRANAD